ncbi:MAG: tetratricopeptide repeat protein, partial [Sphingopyxis sp.]|nr:tetratricopeptide repeat protein [Sphingopyxis sp.]
PGTSLAAALLSGPVSDARQGIGQWFGLLGDGFARTPGGNPELALLLARAASWLDPADPFAQLALAEALVKAEQNSIALDVLERAAASEQGEGGAYALRRAELLAVKGQTEAALAAAMPRSGVLPTDRAWLIRFADIARRAKDPEIAERVFDQLLTLTGDSVDDGELRAALFIAKADIRIKQGRWAEARPLLEQALAASPDDATTLNFVGYSALERRDDVPEALARVEAAWQRDTANAAITDSLGWAYVITGDVARGVPLLERAARGEPTNAVINEHLGDAYWKSGRYIEARYSWRAAALNAEDAMVERLATKIAEGLTAATLAP